MDVPFGRGEQRAQVVEVFNSMGTMECFAGGSTGSIFATGPQKSNEFVLYSFHLGLLRNQLRGCLTSVTLTGHDSSGDDSTRFERGSCRGRLNQDTMLSYDCRDREGMAEG